jgi:trans-aconitate 2-methyltransferase
MVKKTFSDNLVDLDASYYVEHSSLQNNLAKEILSSFQISSAAHILDVGCGDGRITAELANHAKQGRVLGIDASPQMIEFAIENFPREGFSNLSFFLGKAEEIDLEQSYDLIVSFSCFHWIKDPKLAIRRLTSCLRIGGELLILTYPKESFYYRHLQAALKKFPEYYPHSANQTMLSIDGYRKLLLEKHFKILEFQQRELTATYSTFEEIQDYIKGWLASYVPIPETLQDSFLLEICNAIREEPTAHRNGKISIPYTALIIKARKES